MAIKVMTWYWDNSALDGHKLLTILALADWASEDGTCFPRMETIAKKARKELRATQRTIKQLENDGEILVYEGQGGGKHGKRSALFYLESYRKAHGIITPPEVKAEALRYRKNSRKQGLKGRTGATGDTSSGVQPTTPQTGATGDTRRGATRCTQIRHGEPSLYQPSVDPLDPPPPILHRSISTESKNGGGGFLGTLAIELISSTLPNWTNPSGYIATLTADEAHILCGWLWIVHLLHWSEQMANPYTDYAEQERIEKLYGCVFAGARSEIAVIRKHVTTNTPAPLAPDDAASLEQELQRYAGKGEAINT